jgi:hypothetical protein
MEATAAKIMALVEGGPGTGAKVVTARGLVGPHPARGLVSINVTCRA